MLNTNEKTNIAILEQVVFKCFVDVNKRLPEEKDYELINHATLRLFANISQTQGDVEVWIKNNTEIPPFV